MKNDDDEVVGTCSPYGQLGNAYKVLDGGPPKKYQHG
jgi:hypothetical protein